MPSYFNRVGFGVSFLVCLLVLSSALTKTIPGNAAWIIGLFAIQLLFSIAFPRLFPKQQAIMEWRDGIESFGKLLNKAVLWIALTIVYWLGVGITKAISAIVGKRFLDLSSSKKSYWVSTQGQKKNVEDPF